MKTTKLKYPIYWIVKNEGLKDGEKILRTDKFDKDFIQKIFDETAKQLKVGETLEYGKEDAKQFYPAMLFVEMEKDGLRVYNSKGYKKKYIPKF